MTSAQRLEEWEAWLGDRPSHVRRVAEKFLPWHWYRIRGGHPGVGRIIAYTESECEDCGAGPEVAVRILIERNHGLPVPLQIDDVDPTTLVLVEEDTPNPEGGPAPRCDECGGWITIYDKCEDCGKAASP